jgi:hypothetical protein
VDTIAHYSARAVNWRAMAPPLHFNYYLQRWKLFARDTPYQFAASSAPLFIILTTHRPGRRCDIIMICDIMNSLCTYYRVCRFIYCYCAACALLFAIVCSMIMRRVLCCVMSGASHPDLAIVFASRRINSSANIHAHTRSSTPNDVCMCAHL